MCGVGTCEENPAGTSFVDKPIEQVGHCWGRKKEPDLRSELDEGVLVGREGRKVAVAAVAAAVADDDFGKRKGRRVERLWKESIHLEAAVLGMGMIAVGEVEKGVKGYRLREMNAGGGWKKSLLMGRPL